MTKRYLIVGLRLFFGLLTLVAMVTQIFYLQSHDAYNAANFFSFFTNLSNIFAGFVLIISALYLAGSRKPSVTDDLIRSASALYMATTGIVYAVLLSNEDLGLLLPWINIVLHYVTPVVMVIDWLYQPPRTKITAKQSLSWLIFPAAFLIYSLIRGPIAHWYAYPFLNPDKVGSYIGVTAYCIVILLGLLAVSWGMRTLGRRLKPHIV